MHTVADWVVRRPRTTIAIFGALTLLLTSFASQLRIESSIESTLPSNSPDVRFYERIRGIFGSDEIGVVGVRAEDLFAETTLRKIQRITSALQRIEGVDKVLSITNAVDPSRDAFSPPPLILQIPPSPQQRAELERELRETPLFSINLVSPDLRGAAINIFFADLSDAEYADLAIDEQIAAIIANEEGPEEIFYTGASHIKREATASMRHDLFAFTPLALALVLGTLWLSFRRVRAVVAPMVTVLIALAWTLGFMAICGKSINLGTFILPPLLLVIGSSYTIHVLAHYYEQLALEASHEEVVRRTLLRVWEPLAISAGTTMVGFGALAINRIPAIRELGEFAVVGILCLTVSCLAILPAILVVWGRSPSASADAPGGASRLPAILSKLGGYAYDARRTVLAAAFVTAAIALFGLLRIRVDSDFLGYFDPGSEVRLDNEAINRTIVASNPFYIVVEGGSAGAVGDWDTLRRIRDLQTFLATLPGVSGSVSLVDYLELIERGMMTGEEDFTIDEDGNLVPFEKPKPFWQDPASLTPLLTLVRKNTASFANVVTADLSTANILVRTSLSGSRATEAVLARVRGYIHSHFPGSMRVTATGTLVLMTGTTSEILIGQIRSLSLALVVIFAVMSLMFLSLRVGVLAILPNAIAIAVFYGLLGWLGIFLNLGTSLIATIALGIAVDSTIHFMARFAGNVRGDPDQRRALEKTMREVGVPIVFTTVALLLGFLTFAASSFVPIRSFGQLTALTLAAALVGNLFVLPALLATTRIITLWDLVGLRLGDDPAHTIPLLAGLRPAQARVVILMGKLRRFTAGEAIVRQGEAGYEMYVMIQGEADVFAADGQQRRELARMHRGDVFGEMALVRNVQRTADVIAIGDVEVLVIDERFVERLRRRYPRIASRVLANMTKILSDRLQRMTERYVATQ